MGTGRLPYTWFIGCTVGLAFLSIHLDAVSAQPNDETDPHEIRENLRDLLNSINGNDLNKVERYRNILGREAEREKQMFNSVKENWRSTHERKAGRKVNSFRESKAGQEVAAFKREVEKSEGLSNYWKIAEAERAHEFVKDYIQVIGHVANATWDLYKNKGTELVKHGESEDCSGSIADKPVCTVCSHAINKTIMADDETAHPVSATFLQGFMEFPYSNFEVKRKLIDVVMCTHSPPVAGETRFYLTRARSPESAYCLDKVESGGKNDTYVLNGRWITWFNEDIHSDNYQLIEDECKSGADSETR